MQVWGLALVVCLVFGVYDSLGPAEREGLAVQRSTNASGVQSGSIPQEFSASPVAHVFSVTEAT